MISVVAPGALTTVQDLGRSHVASHGVPRGGAMDGWALRAANLLVGNDVGAAALEMTLVGPTLTFARDARIAIIGATTSLPHDRSFDVCAGDTLEVGKLGGGARAILAIDGGIATPPVLGSRSSLGARLSAGDWLPLGPPCEREHRCIKPGALLGHDALRAVALDETTLFDSTWLVTPAASRAGIRLSGAHLEGGEIDPTGMVAGTVEVPPDGAPIVLGPDGPATGGYRAVAIVIAADVGGLASLLPGDEVEFERVSVEQAHEAWYVRERALRTGIEDIR